MLPLKTALIATVYLLLSSMAQAESLTSDVVRRFVDSMEQLQSNEVYSEQFMAAWVAARSEQDSPGSLLVSDVVAFMEGQPGQSTLETVVEEHGFDSPKVWGYVGDRALLALGRLEMEDNISQLQQRLVSMRQDVSRNSQFSEEQKQRMLGMINQTASMLERMEQIPASELEAIRPNRAELKHVLRYRNGD